jgi:serine/threonine-protein kinase
MDTGVPLPVAEDTPDGLPPVPFVPPTRQRYTLAEIHAMGGLGRVWLAYDDQIGRSVALKEIRPDRAGDAALWAGFLREARITGQLEHPNIVPVYELGRRPGTGEPFYTMRLVKGRTLSEAAAAYHQQRLRGEAGPLELRELLGVFVAACNAVGYAHARGVVHRDLKGRNVVLGDFGEVIVLDWGLAKVVGDPGGAAGSLEAVAEGSVQAEAAQTQEGQVSGTPAYMAPEQTSGTPGAVGHAADIYGLGAVLYEVLTGQPPFTGGSTEEILRRVREEAPVPPRQRCRAIPRALEAVCLKALAKQPEDRYASVQELAGEIRRWLADEPVAAYRESRLSRLLRWTRRHPALVAGTSALILTATVALGISTALLGYQKSRTEEARRGEAKQREKAEHNLQKVLGAVDRFMTHISVSRERLGQEPRLEILWHQVYEHGASFFKDYLREVAGNSRLRRETGRAHHCLGIIREQLGEFAQAEEAYAQALAIQQQLVDDDPQAPDRRQDLANTYNSLGGLLFRMQRHAEAREKVRHTLNLQEQLVAEHPNVGAYRTQLIRVYSNVVPLFMELDQAKEAEGYCRRALDLSRSLDAAQAATPEVRAQKVNVLHHLSRLLFLSGRFAEADRTFAQALELRRELVTKHPQNPLEQAEAARFLRKSLEELAKLPAPIAQQPRIQNLWANTFHQLAVVLGDQDHWQECPRLLEQAVAHQRAALSRQPSEPAFREDLQKHHRQLVVTLLHREDHAGAAKVVEEFLRDGANEGKDSYAAAGFLSRCGNLAAKDARLTPDQRDRTTTTYGARSLTLLCAALRTGYAKLDQVRKNPDLAWLRERAEFQALLKE